MNSGFEIFFRRGFLVLSLIHFVLSFLTIASLERLVPDLQAPLEKSMLLRQDLDYMLSALTNIDSEIKEEWLSKWQKRMDQLHLHAADSDKLLEQIRPLLALNAEEIYLNRQNHKILQNDLIEIARQFDQDWDTSLKNHRRLIFGGAWSLAIIALVGMIVLAYMYSKMLKNILQPMSEFTQCLIEWKDGNQLRRCTIQGNDAEVRRAMDILNQCLDEKRFGTIPSKPFPP